MAMTNYSSKLVYTGYCGGDTSQPIYVYVAYKSEQNTTTNKSTVYAGMYVTTPAGWNIGAWEDFNGSYVGSTGNTFNGSIPMFTGTRWLAENLSFTVNHNDDGSGSATIYWKWGVNSPWGRIQNISGNFSISLPTIPRKSGVSVGATSCRMGSSLAINIDRKASSFTHTLRYKFGSAAGTIATGVGTSYAWKVPDLASYCNNATSGQATIYCDTYSGSTKIGESSVAVTLTVPAATKPSFPNGDVIIGTGNTITTTRGSANFRLTLTYAFGNSTGTIAEKTTGGVSWTPSYDLAKLIPSATRGYGTLTCTTYNGTVEVGREAIGFYAVVPENEETKPQFTESGLTLTPSGSLGGAFAGLYIKGKTGIKAAFQATSKYSTIAEYSITTNGMVAKGNPATTGVFESSGTIKYTATVKDARGFTRSVTGNVEVIHYDIPQVIPATGQNEVICHRCLTNGTPDSGGTHLLIKAGRKYSQVAANGQQNNFCQLRYSIKLSTANSYGDWQTIIAKTDTTTNEATLIVPNAVPSVTASYDVRISAVDDLTEPDPMRFIIPTDEVTLHLKDGGKGAAFFGYAQEDGVLAVYGNLKADAMGFRGMLSRVENGDFNLCLDDGYYLINTGSVLNSPSAGALGILEVLNNTYVMQRATLNNGSVYFRCGTSVEAMQNAAWTKL